MTLSAIHNWKKVLTKKFSVVCDIGGYDFVSYSQRFCHFLLGGEGCL